MDPQLNKLTLKYYENNGCGKKGGRGNLFNFVEFLFKVGHQPRK